MAEIKKCPFCGSDKVYVKSDSKKRDGKWSDCKYVSCKPCGARGSIVFFDATKGLCDDYYEAVYIWNKIK